MVGGMALLPASAFDGVLWEKIGSYAPFAFGAVLSLLEALILGLFMKKKLERSFC